MHLQTANHSITLYHITTNLNEPEEQDVLVKDHAPATVLFLRWPQ